MMNILMHLFLSSPQQPVRSDGVSAEGEGDSGGSPGGVMADRSLGACNIFGNNNIFTYKYFNIFMYLFVFKRNMYFIVDPSPDVSAGRSW